MITKCNTCYDKIWLAAVADLLTNCKGALETRLTEDSNSKRSFTSGVVGGFAAVVCSDLVGCVWSYINPNSDYNRITKVETKVNAIIQQSGSQLNAFKNATESIYKGLNKTIEEVNRQRNDYINYSLIYRNTFSEQTTS